MTPDAVAWALLFVVAVALAYRFADRALRGIDFTHDALAVAPKPPSGSRTKMLASIVPTPESPEAHKVGALALPSEAQSGPAGALPVAPSHHARKAEMLPNLAAAHAAILPRPTSEAAAAITLRDRHVLAAPDVTATLTPAMAIEEPAPPSSPATQPSETAPAPTTIRMRGTRLRARRVGGSQPSLDERIKATRSRRLRSSAKVRRKPSPIKKAPRKAPPRRIGAGPKGSSAFATGKASTRIIGRPQRAGRVSAATAT